MARSSLNRRLRRQHSTGKLRRWIRIVDARASAPELLLRPLSTTCGVSAKETRNYWHVQGNARHSSQISFLSALPEALVPISISDSSPIPNLHTQKYYSYDCAGNRIGVQGDSSGSFPTGLTTDSIKATFNCTNALTGTAAGGPIAFQATTTNPVKAAAVNVDETATIGGTITAGDTLTLVIHDPGLSQAVPVLYIVQSGDTTTTIATAFKNAINGVSALSSLGISATSSGAVLTLTSSSSGLTRYDSTVSSGATETLTLNSVLGATGTISPSTAFTGSPTFASGANTASVTAVSGGGTKTTNSYPVTISSASSTSLTYDNNGNCTSDGTNTYAWDAENRLIKVTYAGSNNYTDLTYDCLGNRQKIVETTSSSVTSTKVFVFCGPWQCEERDGSNGLKKQFFAFGQQDTVTPRSYFYTKDHLGSVREMSHGSGGSYALDSQFAYSPWGEAAQIAGSGATPDFEYTGMYQNSRSGLNLTMFRAYASTEGRWLSRDPLGERIGLNLYGYGLNNPARFIDPLGLEMLLTIGSERPPDPSIWGQINNTGHSAYRLQDTDTGYDSGWLGLTPNAGNLGGHFGQECDFFADVAHTWVLNAAQFSMVKQYTATLTAVSKSGKMPYGFPLVDCITVTTGAAMAAGHPLPGMNRTQMQLSDTIVKLNNGGP